MADMMPWYKQLWQDEGLYSHDPNDPGGETYRGITQRYHGRDIIWGMIDDRREEPNFPAILDEDDAIQTRHMYIVRNDYWRKARGEDLHENARLIADVLADVRFNQGTRAREFVGKALQMTVSLALTPDNRPLVVDGRVGHNTVAAINMLASSEGWPGLYPTIMVDTVGARIEYYIRSTANDPKKLRYLKGWYLRAMRQLREVVVDSTYEPTLLELRDPPAAPLA